MALIATGRLVSTEGLGLDAAGMKLNPRGLVEVDNHFRLISREFTLLGM